MCISSILGQRTTYTQHSLYSRKTLLHILWKLVGFTFSRVVVAALVGEPSPPEPLLKWRSDEVALCHGQWSFHSQSLAYNSSFLPSFFIHPSFHLCIFNSSTEIKLAGVFSHWRFRLIEGHLILHNSTGSRLPITISRCGDLHQGKDHLPPRWQWR